MPFLFTLMMSCDFGIKSSCLHLQVQRGKWIWQGLYSESGKTLIQPSNTRIQILSPSHLMGQGRGTLAPSRGFSLWVLTHSVVRLQPLHSSQSWSLSLPKPFLLHQSGKLRGWNNDQPVPPPGARVRTLQPFPHRDPAHSRLLSPCSGLGPDTPTIS